jgi:hypothetical protein
MFESAGQLRTGVPSVVVIRDDVVEVVVVAPPLDEVELVVVLVVFGKGVSSDPSHSLEIITSAQFQN